MVRRLDLSPKSRYIGTKLFEQQFEPTDPREGVFNFFGLWDQIDIPEADDDTFVTLKEDEGIRLDALADRFYDSEEYWWILALVNGINDPIAEGVVSGRVIRVPSLSSITTALSKVSS